MKLFSRTITFDEKELQAEIARIEDHLAALEEHINALDEAIREALDFLTGWNGQGKIAPNVAMNILNEALARHGAQILHDPS